MNAYDRQAALMRAMGHPARLRILEILAQGEACVCHLAAVLRQRQPFVSQHLMALRRAGLVRDRRDGALVYYRLSDELVTEVMAQMRRLLQAVQQDVALSPAPRPPVAGCTCPACTGGDPRVRRSP